MRPADDENVQKIAQSKQKTPKTWPNSRRDSSIPPAVTFQPETQNHLAQNTKMFLPERRNSFCNFQPLQPKEQIALNKRNSVACTAITEQQQQKLLLLEQKRRNSSASSAADELFLMATPTPIATTNTDVRLIQVQRSHCHFKVYVQGGNGGSWDGKTIFLTVHDVGSTPQSFIDFVNHPCMATVKLHSIFLHVCIPGQDVGEPDLLGDFPSMDQIGENLVHVLDTLDVKHCIGLGEGAGADILCRFAMSWPNRVLGLVLIHCLDTPHGIIDSFKETLVNLRLSDGQMNSADWDYLYAHKFGLHSKPLKDAYMEEVSATLNPQNLSRYLYNFSHRTDISERIAKKMDDTFVLLVAGGRTPHIENVRHMYENMSCRRATLLILDDVLDVRIEAPTRFCRAMILFCKGFGELSGVQIPGLERIKTPSGSMEEADRPSGRYSPLQKRYSITEPTAKFSHGQTEQMTSFELKTSMKGK